MQLREVLNQFLLDCEVRGRSLQTISWYKQRLGLFAQMIDQEQKVTELEEVQISHLRQFIQYLLASKADAHHPNKPAQEHALSVLTVRGYVRALKVFFVWCVDEDLLSTNPATRLRQPKAPVFLVPTFSPEHINALLVACDQKTPLGFRNYVLLLLLLDTGMRVPELCGLRLADVHDRYVKVFGKGRKEREIGIHPEVSKLLWKYLHKYRKPASSDEPNVFLNRTGGPLKVSGVEEIFKELKQKCGLEGVRVSPHTFRHTFARMYLEQGGEVFKLSREMGHSTIQVTETYLKDFRSTEARREHTVFSPISRIDLNQTKRSGRQNKKEK
ncbi:MAG TPA: tyrosine-type recombinase/integrase [Ktedonobacterales bacterium]|nr:tyrosine-type recombinase/integrase [Ktedonobacterales bacterium]